MDINKEWLPGREYLNMERSKWIWERGRKLKENMAHYHETGRKYHYQYK